MYICTFSMHCVQCTNYRLTTFVITAIYHTNHTHTQPNILLTILILHHHRHQQTYYILYIYVRTFMRARKKFVFLQACGYARENRNYLIDRFLYSLYYHKMAQMMSVCSSLLLIWWQVLIFFYN